VSRVLGIPLVPQFSRFEILFDIDINGAQAAREVGVRLRRTASLNTSPCFIAMLEAPVQERCHAEP
jgi:protoheme ferro-lyase